ncbi:MAG: glycosyltransferase family 2 protein [Pyrinomonadaceae bacterium]
MTPLTPQLRQSEETPLVSVIMPAYNVAPYIGEALESVFAQTFTHYEVIVVNDGSPDTEELERAIAPFRPLINYIKQDNRGVSAARNAATRVARGTFVAHLDPDDAWEPNYLTEQMAVLARDPSIDVLYPDAVIFGEGPHVGRRYMEWCPSTGEVTVESLLSGCCYVLCAVTARRETLVRVGLFDEELRCAEDFDLWLRVLKSGGRIAYHVRSLVRYRQRSDSHTADFKWLRDSFLRVLEKAEQSLDLSPAELSALLHRRDKVKAEAALHKGRQAFFRGDTKVALESIRRANAHFKSFKLTLTVALLRSMPQLLRHAYNFRDRYVWRSRFRSSDAAKSS